MTSIKAVRTKRWKGRPMWRVSYDQNGFSREGLMVEPEKLGATLESFCKHFKGEEGETPTIIIKGEGENSD